MSQLCEMHRPGFNYYLRYAKIKVLFERFCVCLERSSTVGRRSNRGERMRAACAGEPGGRCALRAGPGMHDSAQNHNMTFYTDHATTQPSYIAKHIITHLWKAHTALIARALLKANGVQSSHNPSAPYGCAV